MADITINPLSANLSQLFNTEPIKTAVEQFGGSDGNFANILSESFAATASTDAIDKSGSLDLLTGEADDLSGLMLNMQKAELALNLSLQIRNKIIDAYNEVMRMSV